MVKTVLRVFSLLKVVPVLRFDDFHEIQCSTSEIYNVKKELEKKINNFISTSIEWIPLNKVKITKNKQEDLINFFETLEDNDDVQNIYSNAEFVN